LTFPAGFGIITACFSNLVNRNKTNEKLICPEEEVNAMTKADLIDAVAKAAKINKRTAGEAVDATFDNLSRALKKNKRFQVPGFGTFSVRSRKARKGRNPQTGAVITIKASRTVGFKPAPTLKNGL
jgi:DNA-binding protein HU-beta